MIDDRKQASEAPDESKPAKRLRLHFSEHDRFPASRSAASIARLILAVEELMDECLIAISNVEVLGIQKSNA